MKSCAALYPFELNGDAQHKPITSSGIHKGLPALLDTASSASGRLGEASLSGSRPNMRLMHAGKYTAAASLRSLRGNRRAGLGMGPGTAGMRSSLIALLANSVSPLSGP